MISLSWGDRHLEPYYLIPTFHVANCRHCNTLIFGFIFLKLHLIVYLL